MKKLFVILSFLSFFCLRVNGQVVNFFTEGSRWIYNTQESWEAGMYFKHDKREQNIIHGDSILNGVLYKMLYTTTEHITTSYLPYPQPIETTYSYDSTGPSFIRFDSLLNSVFYLDSINADEKKIYDFNLSVGDSTLLPIPYSYRNYVIDSIEIISFFGLPVKKYILRFDFGASGENYIIQGMGGSNGLTYANPFFYPLSGGMITTYLECFEIGDSIFSLSPTPCTFLTYISGINDADNLYKINLYPNPTTIYLNIITIFRANQPIHYQIINTLGAIVASHQTATPAFSIDVSALPAGIYLLQLQSGNAHTVKRFVKE